MEKIAIITIATGKYKKLFLEFKKQVNEKFLPKSHKDILLFTDDININHDNIIYTSHLPWPLCTLLRFHYINKEKQKLSKFDYIYYIDVDMIPCDFIYNEVLPTKNEIVCVKHYWKHNSIEIYENQNKKSSAYVNNLNQQDIEYCQGCFFGSTANNFLIMSDELEKNINIDLSNNIIAKWHDESHFNKYILNKPRKTLNVSYAHPASIPINQNPNGYVKIMHINAHAYGLD